MGNDSKSDHLICIPGQRICPVTENTISGEGTYERGGYVYSNISGVLKFRISDQVRPSKIFCAFEFYHIQLFFILSFR